MAQLPATLLRYISKVLHLCMDMDNFCYEKELICHAGLLDSQPSMLVEDLIEIVSVNSYVHDFRSSDIICKIIKRLHNT